MKIFETQPEIKLLAHSDVIHVVSENDPTVLLAFNIRLILTGKDLFIEWYDSSHLRNFRINRIIENNDVEFSFERGDSEPKRIYHLKPLSLAIYNQNVKSLLMAPHEFDTEEELLTALRSAHTQAL